MKILRVLEQRFSQVPIIDIQPLIFLEGDRHAVAAQIGQACRESGFFYIVGHGVDQGLQQRLEQLKRMF